MTQGVLPFKYEEEKNDSGMTALAGLPIYLDLARVFGLSASIAQHVKIRENTQGWTDQQVLTSLILLNLAGGTSVDDLKILNADPGFCEILRKAELHGLKRKERRVLEKRWRKEKKRFVPSPSAIFRYLSGFHNDEQEKIRAQFAKSSFIPAPNEHLRGLTRVNADLCRALNTANPHHTATLDMDATLVGYGCYPGGDGKKRRVILLQRLQILSTAKHLVGRAGHYSAQ